VLESADDTALPDDATAVTSAVLAASRLMVAVSLRSLAAAEERVTLPQFRLLLLLDGHGETNLVTLAERLLVNPSTALRMVARLANRRRSAGTKAVAPPRRMSHSLGAPRPGQ
jgi:MarR family